VIFLRINSARNKDKLCTRLDLHRVNRFNWRPNRLFSIQKLSI